MGFGFSNKGFSLAEVLVVLVLVGQVATYTIPKVLISVQDQHKKAVFKETISIVNNVLYNGMLTGELDRGINLGSHFVNSINSLQVCTDFTECHGGLATVHGDAIVGGGSAPDNRGIVLPSGAIILDIDNRDHDCTVVVGMSQCMDIIDIDWNGEQGPNRYGDDILQIFVVYGSDDRSHSSYYGG